MPNALTWSIVACLAAAPAARADDPWESNGDDNNQTLTHLRHGDVQAGHDLDAPPPSVDLDWFMIATKARHSYEARVSSSGWQGACTGSSCAAWFARVNAAGVALTEGVIGNEDPILVGETSAGRTARWIEPTGSVDYLVAFGRFSAFTAVYDITWYDTTLFVPRWNNTATQTTVLFLQNTTNVTVTGSLYFHDGAGMLLATVPVSVPRHGLQVVSTASVPALAGQSGSAQIAQLGGYSALVGKAVALEPGTGFTFDTAVVSLAR